MDTVIRGRTRLRGETAVEASVGFTVTAGRRTTFPADSMPVPVKSDSSREKEHPASAVISGRRGSPV